MPGIKTEISATPSKGWFEFAGQSPEHSVFCTREWFEVLVKSFGYYRPYYGSVWRNGELAAIMPIFDVSKYGGHKILSLPLSYGGPIVHSKDSEVVRAVFKIFAQKLNFPVSYKRLSLPYFSTFEDDAAEVLEKSGFRKETFTKYVLKTEGMGAEKLWEQRVSRKQRNSIRKAEKSGIELREINAGEIGDAIAMAASTARRLGIQPDREEFMRNIHKILIPAGMSRWTAAFMDGKMIATSVFLYGGGTATYFTNASDKSYSNISPSSLLLWDAIKEAVRRGCTIIDLGSAPEGFESLQHFKESFGAVPTTYIAYTKSTLLYRLLFTIKSKVSSIMP